MGEQPQRFSIVVLAAIMVLELLITKEVKKSLEKNLRERNIAELSSSENSKVSIQKWLAEKAEQNKRTTETQIGDRDFFQEIQLKEKETISKPQPQPKMSLLASELPRLSELAQKLKKQNQAIYEREQELLLLEKTLDKTKGFFKGKQRRTLQEQIDQLKQQIGNMKHISLAWCKSMVIGLCRNFKQSILLPKRNITNIRKRLLYGRYKQEERQSLIV